MEYFRLLLGLLLPWIGGYYFLAAIENRFNRKNKANTLRRVGYGLFLGYAGLQGIVLASATALNRVEFWPVLAAVALLTAAAGLLSRTSQATVTHPQTTVAVSPQQWKDHTLPGRTSPASRILFSILLGCVVLHLSFAAIEILSRPVYPWDAWLAWVYRAKAWFYTSNVYELASPRDWLAGTATVPYTIGAHDYPAFASIIPFWAALSLGEWSETLVNLPVLCCGIALGLGIYGQCREYGMQPLLSAAAAYFLLSIPLIGTHLSLAGYADIWLAGFTGLGFAALIPGLAGKNKTRILLGLVMIALGIGVKNEGLVWFCLALALLLFNSIRTRTILAMLAATILLGFAASWSGLTYLEFPGAGGIGVLNDKLHIPLVGSYQIQAHNVLRPYWSSLFTFGSWHLLWTLLLLVAGSLFFSRRTPASRLIGIFLVLFLASQTLIFGFTEQGKWATSYTAINRLPIHFTPALVLCLFICLHNLLKEAKSNGGKSDGGAEPGIIWYSLPALISALLITVGTIAYLQPEHAPSAEARHFFAKDLKVVIGRGKIRNDTVHITGYQNGLAITSSGPISINAKNFPVLAYDLASSQQDLPIFFWRTASNPGDIETIDAQPDASGIIRLSAHPSWRGEITEIGVTFYAGPDRVARISELSLMPETLGANIAALWRDWVSFTPWSGSSINWFAGGRTGLAVPAPILLALWLISTLSLYLVSARLLPARTWRLTAFSLVTLVAWGLIDLRWIATRLDQTRLTFSGGELTGEKACIDLVGDCHLADLTLKIRDTVAAEQEKKVLIAYENKDSFRALRLKYRLLPLPAITYVGSTLTLPKRGEDYILLLNRNELKYREQPKDSLQSQSKFKSSKNTSIDALWESPDSAFYKINRIVK